MKVEVLNIFEDVRIKGKFYKKGDIVEFPDDRAMNLVYRNLAKKVEDIEDIKEAKAKGK